MSNTSNPTSRAQLKLFEPGFGEDLCAQLAQRVTDGNVLVGDLVEDLEKRVADYLGVKEPQRVVGVSSGTAALELAMCNTPRKGYKVLVPALTMAATVHAILRAGLVPKLVDVGPDLLVSRQIISDAMDDKVGGVCVVDYAGACPDMVEIADFCSERDLVLWEDAAEAFGATSRGKRAGTLSNIACFSIHPIKPLAGFGGGLLVNNLDEPRYHRLPRELRRYGMRDRVGTEYDIKTPGMNYGMSDLSALAAIHSFKTLEERIALRQEVAFHYIELLSSYNKYVDMLKDGGRTMGRQYGSAHHLFPVVLPFGTDRKRIVSEMAAVGIETGTHFKPVHWFTAHNVIDHAPLPNTNAVGERILTLPCHHKMSKDDVHHVLDILEVSIRG